MRFFRKLRDNADIWPTLRVTIQVLPWNWKLTPWIWTDDVSGFGISISWLFLEIWLWWNNPPFSWD